MIVIGIDPGLTGALVAMGRFEPIAISMPVIGTGKRGRRQVDAKGLKEWLDRVAVFDDEPPHVFIEKVFAMGRHLDKRTGRMVGQSTMTAFTFGMGYGIILGVVESLGFPHTLVSPKTWQKAMLRDLAHEDTKKASVWRANQLFPHVQLKRTSRSRIDDHGMADALLIAEYGSRQLRGERVF